MTFKGRISTLAVLSAAALCPGAGVAQQAETWTGSYAGVQLGYGDLGAPAGETGVIGGIHLGYGQDFGRIVLGAEADYDFADLGSVDGIGRLKLRAGYDFGQALGYVTAGVARADAAGTDDTGPVYGIGFAYRLDNGIDFGAEVLHHDFDGATGGAGDLDATTITVRGSIRF